MASNVVHLRTSILGSSDSHWLLYLGWFTKPPHYSIQKCPFGKNRGAGSWVIPSTIKETCCFSGVSEETPLLINQPMGKGHHCISTGWWLSHPSEKY